MRHLRFHAAYKNAQRLKDIAAVLVSHGFYPILDRLGLKRLVGLSLRLRRGKEAREMEERPIAERARRAFEELGPTFIKLGQIISTRPDVMPDDIIAEFLKLQDEVSPLPFGEIKAVIEREFGKPIGALFKSVDETPVAAASIAQVHRATTLDGSDVVIKVQRPGIEAIIEADTSILAYLARLLERYVPESRIYGPVDMINEFATNIKKELDFTLEASHTERFRENFSGDKRVKIPRVFWELSGAKVLTVERIKGIKVDNAEKLRDEGIDLEAVAHVIADSFFRQVFDMSLFHGDLHAGNIFVVDKDTVAFVDFGIVGWIDKETRSYLADILIGFVKEDFEAITEVYHKMGMLPEHADETAFKREYWEMMQHYLGRPFKHVSVGELFLDYIKLAARHNVRLPKDLLLFDKCILELEGLARVLYPDVNLLKEAEPYAMRLVAERVGPRAMARDTARAAIEYGTLIKELPKQAEEIMNKVINDRVAFEVSLKGIEEFMGEMDRSSNRLTFGVIIAALIIGSSVVIASDAGPKVYGYPFFGVLGFVIAGCVGLWLAFLILKSGKY
jgi:ubiquinone biosynthesis protein